MSKIKLNFKFKKLNLKIYRHKSAMRTCITHICVCVYIFVMRDWVVSAKTTCMKSRVCMFGGAGY